MNKFLTLVFASSFIVSPVLSWGEGGCSFSNRTNASQDDNVEKVESSNSTDK